MGYFIEEVTCLEEIPHPQANFSAVQGLGQEIVGAEEESAVSSDRPVISGEHDHWQKAQRSTSAPEAAQNLQSVWLWHMEVQQEQVRLEVGEGPLGRLRVSYAADLVGDIGQKALDQIDVSGLVVHN